MCNIFLFKIEVLNEALVLNKGGYLSLVLPSTSLTNEEKALNIRQKTEGFDNTDDDSEEIKYTGEGRYNHPSKSDRTGENGIKKPTHSLRIMGCFNRDEPDQI